MNPEMTVPEMDLSRIKTFVPVSPRIYAYSTPEVPKHDGWVKIGYTEKQSVDDRIRQQTHTAGLVPKKEWDEKAQYTDGSEEYFTDREFHSYLESYLQIEREPGLEWFNVDGQTSKRHFDQFASLGKLPGKERLTYVLRKEQADAVKATKKYFDDGGEEFLWNAKPRFGKTLTAYDLIQKMGFRKVLIVTNRPSISKSWIKDFFKFVGWKGEYGFISETPSARSEDGVLTRNGFLKLSGEHSKKGFIAFESLQGLKGSAFFGGEYDKLDWIREIEFDLLIVDESQEGVDTLRTENAFEKIRRQHTLYLSGTPFKQIEEFPEDQVFNWSYADEQDAKRKHENSEDNPYFELPKLSLFTYELSPMLHAKVQKGLQLPEEGKSVSYTFDLNEFFSTKENGKFKYEDDVRKFLVSLTTQEKYPFSPEFRDELKHTLWHLDRIDSVNALEKLLKENDVFKEYKIINATGDGSSNDNAKNRTVLKQVTDAIAENDKTITLTVGQLTVGVTVPEWTAVLMLCNMKSAQSYIQAAFRAQNPCIITRDGQRYRKENAYVFDFDPARTLEIYDKYASNLCSATAGGSGTVEEHNRNIRELLNFLPVIGEDPDGRMVALDADQVQSIPRMIKSRDVVQRGFMSDFLFQNIGRVFGASAYIREILDRLPQASASTKALNKKMKPFDGLPVDNEGDVNLSDNIAIGQFQDSFGPKLFKDVMDDVTGQARRKAQENVKSGENAVEKHAKTVIDAAFNGLKDKLVDPAVKNAKISKSAKNQIERETKAKIEDTINKIKDECLQKEKEAKVRLEREIGQAASKADKDRIRENFKEEVDAARKEYEKAVETATDSLIEETSKDIAIKVEKAKVEEKKKGAEYDIKSHMRGFSRTIPSFIMAFGDDNLRLDNFDQYVDADVFQEVAKIEMKDFRFLRDGGKYTDENGEEQEFAGKLFNEEVFNDSIKEFLSLRKKLANYFDENQDEDIFEYIPPQETNQIFTPRKVVSMMVDTLEKENEGCFDDPEATFADLYMKSGQYITEIVKRLFRSEGLKKAFPDEQERIRHILEKQVYGAAPTEIIYRIAKNYILGFDEALNIKADNFKRIDTMKAAQEKSLKKEIDDGFGEDVER